MFTLKTPFVEFLKSHETRVVPWGSCDRMENEVQDLLRENPGMTVREMLDETPENYMPLGIIIMGPVCDESVVTHMIGRIESYQFACDVYLRYKYLTDEQDKLLLSLFEGKVPTIEWELSTGRVVREKDRP